MNPLERVAALAEPGKALEIQEIISTPVGREGGRVVFAHLRFDSHIRRDYIACLKEYLGYLESVLFDEIPSDEDEDEE